MCLSLWGKTAGGDKVTWVGFELFHSTYLGISERRAARFIKWAEVASSDTVNTANFEEGLSRLMHVCSFSRTTPEEL